MNSKRISITTLKNFSKFIVFLLLFLIILNYVSCVLKSKAGDEHTLSGQMSTDSTYDVIFAGSSHMNNAVYPFVLWKDYGFTAFNNAQSGEIIPVSYYTASEAIETYNPKVLVLDMYMLYHDEKYGSIKWAHQSLDNLSVGNRIPAILDLLPITNWSEFLLPVTMYHDRWKEIKKIDFTGKNSVTRGAAQNFNIATDITGMTFEYTPADIKVQPNEIAVEYLDKIVNMCAETDTELLLVTLPYFISSEYKKPTHDMSNDQAYFNWVADYAEENGLNYINYFHLVDEIGFVWTEHLYNYSHMNYWGGSIITRHIGAFLNENYNLPDRRNDDEYQHWNEDIKKYNKQVKGNLKKAKENK